VYAWVKDTAGIVWLLPVQQVTLVEMPNRGRCVQHAFDLGNTHGACQQIYGNRFWWRKGLNLVTESPVAPAANDPAWSAVAPSSFTFSRCFG